MSDLLPKSTPTTCEATPNATSLPESQGGPTPSSLPEYHQTSLSGLDLLPASPSAVPGVGEDTTTSDISHPSGLISSVSAALQSSLASRLQQQLPAQSTPGWMIYRMHWKQKATPAGRQYCQLVASVRPTSGKDSFSELIGWPTPASRDWKDTGTIPPSKQDGNGGVKAAYLGQTVPLCGWPTPTRGDAANAKNNGAKRHNPDSKHHAGTTLVDAGQMAGWPTPRTETGGSDHSQIRPSGHSGTTNPSGAAQLAGWATTLANPARLKPDGTLLTGSSAAMPSGGQLNPAHSRWLMGYPPEWDDCGVMAMQ